MKFSYLFYFCDGIDSVFDSQVLALLKTINSRNIFKEIYLFLGIRNENQKKDFLSRKLSPEIKTVFFKTYPNYQLFIFMNRKKIQNAILSQSINLKEVIFHTRGDMIAYHISQVLGKEYYKNIIPDVRGAFEEIKEFYDLNKILKLLKINIYKKAVENLNKFYKISVVSYSLKDHLIANHKIDVKKVVITPCLAGNDFKFYVHKREEIRKEFNLSIEDVLIVFSSGGTANWQNNEVLIMLAKKGIKVLNLSKKEILHKNVFNKFVSYSEMPSYLNAADVAIIWRDKSIGNKVASPVKFSEYICCGLPVIANSSVDMISEYITKHDSGVLIDSLDDIELRTLKDLKQKNREKISETGILNFGIETIVDKYLKTYSSIICL